MMDILWNTLDIAITAYIVYWLIRLIQGTRAMHVVWGVIILSLLTLFSRVMLLHATAWLFQQFWLAGIVLLIVVFQPEIRAALAELGSRPLGRMIGSRELDFIKELMEAARYCSEVRMGLLVVLEQEMGLRDIVNTGTRVNGEVSKELLLAIFNTKAPLHDGAVVVANNRLVAAGCILPLTQEHELAKIFGMRHRAAVGITETSDALALVVSEETGRISLVRGGRLQEISDADDLERRLYDLYRTKAESNLLRKSSRS